MIALPLQHQGDKYRRRCPKRYPIENPVPQREMYDVGVDTARDERKRNGERDGE
jgi:hypothetical protein